MGSSQRVNTQGAGRQQGRGDPEIWGERDGRGCQGGSQPRCPQAQPSPRFHWPLVGPRSLCRSCAFCTWGSQPGPSAKG